MFGKHKAINDEFAIRWEASREKFYRLAYCYVKNEADALEILSEATYKAYCSIQKLKDIELFDTWMSRILINEACRFLRKQKRFTEYDEAVIVEKSTKEDTGTRDYEAVEAEIDIYRLLDLVSEDEKALLILKYFEERSFREIADIMEMPENTVKTKIYRLLERLRLHAEGGFNEQST